jgi:hypothetical protein
LQNRSTPERAHIVARAPLAQLDQAAAVDSKPTRENQDDENDHNDADDANDAMTITVTIAAQSPSEATLIAALNLYVNGWDGVNLRSG